MSDKKLKSGSLGSLIEKFSRQDVIAEMEKEYQNAPAKLIRSSQIEDTSFLSEVPLSDITVEYFANAIKDKGVYNPLVVRPKGDKYEVILGRKRYFGARKIGIISMPCVILEIGDEETLLMLLADTRDHRNVNVVEMAVICSLLREKFHYTHQTLAELSFSSRSQITNILRILKLPFDVRKMICFGELSYGHARAIVNLKEKELRVVLEEIKEKKLSVRETEALINPKNTENKGSGLSFLKRYGVDSYKQKDKDLTLHFKDENSLKAFLSNLKKRV